VSSTVTTFACVPGSRYALVPTTLREGVPVGQRSVVNRHEPAVGNVDFVDDDRAPAGRSVGEAHARLVGTALCRDRTSRAGDRRHDHYDRYR